MEMLPNFKLYSRDVFNFSILSQEYLFNTEYIFKNKYKKIIRHFLCGFSLMQRYGFNTDIQLNYLVNIFPDRLYELPFVLNPENNQIEVENYDYAYWSDDERDLNRCTSMVKNKEKYREIGLKYKDDPSYIDFLLQEGFEPSYWFNYNFIIGKYLWVRRFAN